MAKEKERPEDDGPQGAPEWMVTFSDCMTLLLTFFVLLLSFSEFGPDELPSLGKIMTDAMPSTGIINRTDESSTRKNIQFQQVEKVNDGTETKTESDSKENDSYMKEKKPLDFRNLKVFSIASNKVFWGSGTALTQDGQKILDYLSKYVRKIPSRVIVSENGAGANQNIGFTRALAIINYMSESGSIDRNCLSLSASSTTIKRNRSAKRMVEITLLDRNVY